MSNKLLCCAVIAVLANMMIAKQSALFFMLITVAFICFCVALALIKRMSLSFSLVLICIWFIFAGLRFYADTTHTTKISSLYGEQPVYVEGTIHSPVTRDGDRVQFELMLKRLTMDHRQVEIKEKVMVQLYLKQEQDIPMSEQLNRGKYIKVSGELKQPQAAQNVEQFDYRLFLSRQHIHWIVQANSIEAVEVISDDRSRAYQLLYYFDTLKQKLYYPFHILFEAPHAGYLGGLVFGMKDELNPELFQSFSKLGLTHILAVSGLHVAVVVTCLLTLFKAIKLPRSYSYTITIAALPFYIIITGAEPSIIRAGIMGMIGLWLLKRQKLKNTSSILAAAALIMVAFNPLIIYSIGFQLSFLVTLGLLMFTPLIRRALSLRTSKWLDLLAVTLSAQLISFPLTIYYFNTFNPLSIVANLILVPYISFIILPLATLTNMVAHISLEWAKPFAALTKFGNNISFYLIEGLNKWDSMNLIWKSPSLLWIGLWYLVLFALATALSQLRRLKSMKTVHFKSKFNITAIYKRLTAILLCFFLLVVFAYNPNLFALKGEGSISFISVGQGDSILIRTPQHKYILVDSGGQLPFVKKEAWAQREKPFDVGADIIVPLLKKRGIKQLDAIVITHLDADHYQGFLAILDHIKVKEVWYNGTWKKDELADQLVNKIAKHAIPIKAVYQGDSMKLDKHTFIHVLWPIKRLSSYVDKQNEHSIVFILQMYEARILLTGDIGEKTEKEITTYMYNKYGDSKIDILKVAHHGSKYSTSPYILSYFDPTLAVVSVGKNNRYGHPHKDVLARLRSYNTHVLRTDLNGEILFKINRKAIYYLNW